MILLYAFKRILTRCCRAGAVTVVFKQPFKRTTDVFVIIYYKHMHYQIFSKSCLTLLVLTDLDSMAILA